MLNLVLKTGDRIQIGDNVIIKRQSDSRAQLAIDAPREVQIKRIEHDGVGKTVKKTTLGTYRSSKRGSWFCQKVAMNIAYLLMMLGGV